MTYLTLSPQNQMTFTCPIFDVATSVRQCVKLRDKVYRGEHIAVRRGCQACMASGKCPAAEIVRRIAFNSSNASDDMSSLEPASGKLSADILEHILPVMVMDNTLTRYRVPPEERELIEGSNERIAKLIGSAPRRGRTEAKQPRIEAQARKTVIKTKAEPAPAAINHAAATGDLSAAINT